MTAKDSAGEQAAYRLIKEGRYEESFPICQAAARAGSADAQLLLGWMYQLGNGVQADLEEAEKWYLKAAETRHGKAEFCLATLFRQKGQQTAALHWFEKSASHGYAPGIYALGRIYLVGDGVTADREKAFRYFDEAAEKGHLYARTRIARDTILGRRGISRIPAGALLSIRTFLAVVKQSLRDPESELFSEQ